jgi:hypothetical protein
MSISSVKNLELSNVFAARRADSEELVEEAGILAPGTAGRDGSSANV